MTRARGRTGGPPRQTHPAPVRSGPAPVRHRRTDRRRDRDRLQRRESLVPLPQPRPTATARWSSTATADRRSMPTRTAASAKPDRRDSADGGRQEVVERRPRPTAAAQAMVFVVDGVVTRTSCCPACRCASATTGRTLAGRSASTSRGACKNPMNPDWPSWRAGCGRHRDQPHPARVRDGLRVMGPEYIRLSATGPEDQWAEMLRHVGRLRG